MKCPGGVGGVPNVPTSNPQFGSRRPLQDARGVHTDSVGASRKHLRDVPTFQHSVLFPFVLIFLRTLLRLFAFAINSTPFVSSDSALFGKKTRGVGTPARAF